MKHVIEYEENSNLRMIRDSIKMSDMMREFDDLWKQFLESSKKD